MRFDLPLSDIPSSVMEGIYIGIENTPEIVFFSPKARLYALGLLRERVFCVDGVQWDEKTGYPNVGESWWESEVH